MLHSTAQLLANPRGNDRLDPVVFTEKTGEWFVLNNEAPYTKPNIQNTWQAWNINYRPLVNGVPQTYDSGDREVIRELLKMISEAKIDYLLFDLTNNIKVDNGYIYERTKKVIDEISKWNDDPNNRPIQYVIAIGGNQFNNDISVIDNEAKIILDEVYNKSGLGGDHNYFHLNGKSLLVNYLGNRVTVP